MLLHDFYTREQEADEREDEHIIDHTRTQSLCTGDPIETCQRRPA